MKKYQKYIGAVCIIFILIGCVIWIAIQQTVQSNGNIAEIRVANEVVQTLDLNHNTRVTVNGKNNIILTVVVSDGSVYVESSECPDKICVHKGKISHESETIVCLPAQTIVEVKSRNTE